MRDDRDPYWLFNQLGAAGWRITIGCLAIGAAIMIGGGILLIVIQQPIALVPVAIGATGLAYALRMRTRYASEEPFEAEKFLIVLPALAGGPYEDLNRTEWGPQRVLAAMRRLNLGRAGRLAVAYQDLLAREPRPTPDAPIDAVLTPIRLDWNAQNEFFELATLAMVYAMKGLSTGRSFARRPTGHASRLGGTRGSDGFNAAGVDGTD